MVKSMLPDRCGDDWCAKCHRLQQGKPEPFGGVRRDVHVGDLHETEELIAAPILVHDGDAELVASSVATGLRTGHLVEIVGLDDKSHSRFAAAECSLECGQGEIRILSLCHALGIEDEQKHEVVVTQAKHRTTGVRRLGKVRCQADNAHWTRPY